MMPATAQATWSSSLYIFSLLTPTAEVSSNCSSMGDAVGSMDAICAWTPTRASWPMCPATTEAQVGSTSCR